MRLNGLRLVAVLLALSAPGLVTPSHPQEQQDPATLVADAIEAHGGTAALEQWSNLIYSGELTVFFGPSEISGSGTISIRDGKWFKREARLEFRGSLVVFEEASTGGSAWQRRGSRVYDFPPDNANTWLTHRPDILLRAAAADSNDLRFKGNMDLDGDAVLALELDERDGTIRILLDEDTHRVRALEYKMMRNDGMGKKEEAFIKTTYADYRIIDGIPFPHVGEEFSDGAKDSSIKVNAVELGRPPEIGTFARPEADEEAKEWRDQIAN